MPSDDSWNFKIEKPKQKTTKSSEKKTAATKEKIKRRQEASLYEKVGPKVSIPTPKHSKRKSRSELAKEYLREEDIKQEDHPDDIYGSPIRRAFAASIDLVLIAFALILILTYKSDLWIELELQFFGLNDVGQGPLLTYFGSLGFCLYLIIAVLPSIVFGRSLGKALSGVKIYDEEQRPLGFVKTLVREVLFRPLSVLSVVGVLACCFSKKRKMLHDYLIGSNVRRY